MYLPEYFQELVRKRDGWLSQPLPECFLADVHMQLQPFQSLEISRPHLFLWLMLMLLLILLLLMPQLAPLLDPVRRESS